MIAHVKCFGINKKVTLHKNVVERNAIIYFHATHNRFQNYID